MPTKHKLTPSERAAQQDTIDRLIKKETAVMGEGPDPAQKGTFWSKFWQDIALKKDENPEEYTAEKMSSLLEKMRVQTIPEMVERRIIWTCMLEKFAADLVEKNNMDPSVAKEYPFEFAYMGMSLSDADLDALENLLNKAVSVGLKTWQPGMNFLDNCVFGRMIGTENLETVAIRKLIYDQDKDFDKIIERETKKIEEIDKKLIERDRELIERDRELSERDTELGTKDRALSEKDKLLAERDETIKDLKRQIAEEEKKKRKSSNSPELSESAKKHGFLANNRERVEKENTKIQQKESCDPGTKEFKA